MDGRRLENEQATQKVAQELAHVLAAGDCLVLTGDLGAGKTTFTKGLALGLGIDQMIKSPTYTLIREYDSGRLPLYHMDMYRLEEGATDMGLDEYFEGPGICVVEWGKNIRPELPPAYLELFLEANPETEVRSLTWKAHGPLSTSLKRGMEVLMHGTNGEY